MQPGENRQALVKDGTAAERETVLWEITGGNALGTRDRAIVQRFQPREDFQERRFPGAVRAHQAYAVAGRDQPIEIFEENFRAEALSGRG